MALRRPIDRRIDQLELDLHAERGPAIASESGLGHDASLFRVPWPILGGVGRAVGPAATVIVLHPRPGRLARRQTSTPTGTARLVCSPTVGVGGYEQGVCRFTR